MSKLAFTLSLVCWHYTPSLWPWRLWILSCSVSMTMSQARLLVTCVGGFACTEWELHNGVSRERAGRLFGSLLQFEMRIHFMNPAIEQLHVVEDGGVGVFLFIQTSIRLINTLHNCFGSFHSSNRTVCSYDCGSWLASESSISEMRLMCPRPPDKGFILLYAPFLSVGEKCWGLLVTSHKIYALFCTGYLPVTLRLMTSR